MSWRNALSANLPPSREDEPRDLRRDILDELEDHLHCAMTRELLRSPESDEETARRRVLARFGDPAQIAFKLWLDAMKEKIMNQRILIGTNILMAAAVVAMVVLVAWTLGESRTGREALRTQMDEMVGLQTVLVESVQGLQRNGGPPAGAPAAAALAAMDGDEPVTEDWAARFDAIDDNWREAYALGNELLRLPPEEGLAIVQENWTRLKHPQDRQFMLNAFQHSANREVHPHVIDVLHLGMTDPATEVRARAIELFKFMAFIDFSHDPAKYDRWRTRHEGSDQRQIIIESLDDWIERLRGGKGGEYERAMKILTTNLNINTLQHQPFAREAAIEAGLLEVIENEIAKIAASSATRRQQDNIAWLMKRVGELRPDEAYMRRVIRQLLDHANDEVVSAATIALRGPQNVWARDEMEQRLIDAALGRDRGLVSMIAGTLASYGDPAVIPNMIGLIDADGTYNTVYNIGWFGLNPLTGVPYDETHDGAWWRSWWERNKQQYSDEVQAMEIPDFSDRVAERPERREIHSRWPLITLNDDEEKRYFLIGPQERDEPPAEGYKLLLVLPGGDGSADFHHFVASILDEALPDDYLLAQLIAPVFDEGSAQALVWSTQVLQQPNARFTTEEFIDAVIDDVSNRHRINESHIYALGWSSSGPPVYNAGVESESRIAGAFVAMSVFRPDWMPEIGNLTGRAFYILHSPQDFIAMHFPERARDTLSMAGANVHLQTYQGGHGWHGDVYGMIREGVEWLQNQQQHVSRGD